MRNLLILHNYIKKTSPKTLSKSLVALPRNATSTTSAPPLARYFTTTPPPPSLATPIILSRREVASSRPPILSNQTPKPSKPPKKEAETPWPKSLQIAGYVALVLSVPVTICTMIVEVPSFRKFLEGEDEDSDIREGSYGYQVVGLVRRFWGAEEKVDVNGTTEVVLRFENEECGRVKLEQREIGRRGRNDWKVRVLMGNGEEEVVKIGGMVKALEGDIMKMLGKFDSGKDSGLALDFSGLEEGDAGFFSASPEVVPENEYLTEIQREGQEVRRMTETYSTWHHFPENITDQSNTSNSVLSNEDVEKSELLWRESDLLKQLKDPTSTRDIDDLQNDLKEVRKELNRIRGGWRRLLSIGA